MQDSGGESRTFSRTFLGWGQPCRQNVSVEWWFCKCLRLFCRLVTLIRPHHIFTFLLKWQTSSYILPSSIQYGHHSLENRAWWGCKLTEVFSNGKIWVDFTIPIRPSPLPLTPQFCVFMPRSTVWSCLLKGTRGKCSGYMAPQTYETINTILLMLANVTLWLLLCARQIWILTYFNVAFHTFHSIWRPSFCNISADWQCQFTDCKCKPTRCH